MAHSARADFDPFPRHILVRLGPTRITCRTLGSGQLGSQRPVTSHDADYSGSAGSGYISPCTCARSSRTEANSQSTNVPSCRPSRSKEFVAATTLYYAKAYVGARLKLYVTRTGRAALQSVSSIRRRPLFGTQCRDCRPVGGRAGFNSHQHCTATCTHTLDCACPS